jgi:hypothetical protein
MFALPSNSVIREVICYSFQKIEGQIKFVIGDNIYEYTNMSSYMANLIDLSIDRGGIIECEVFGIEARRIDVYYEV